MARRPSTEKAKFRFRSLYHLRSLPHPLLSFSLPFKIRFPNSESKKKGFSESRANLRQGRKANQGPERCSDANIELESRPCSSFQFDQCFERRSVASGISSSFNQHVFIRSHFIIRTSHFTTYSTSTHQTKSSTSSQTSSTLLSRHSLLPSLPLLKLYPQPQHNGLRKRLRCLVWRSRWSRSSSLSRKEECSLIPWSLVGRA